MFSDFFFISWRLGQLLTLIPPVGMLAWFVDGFQKANMLTPTYILLMFIVSVLAVIWALGTLVRYGSTKRSANFVALIDLCFLGAFIAAVYQLRGIATENCSRFGTDATGFMASLGPFGFFGQRQGYGLADDPKKVCDMLKACFAFGIMNIISFAATAFWAWFVYDGEDHHHSHHRKGRSHSSRRGHRRRSGSSRRHDYHV